MQGFMAFINTSFDESGRISLDLNWEEAIGRAVSTTEFVVNKFLSIALIITVMYFSIKVGERVIDKFVKNQISSKLSFSMNTQKAITVGTILKSSLKYAVYFSGGAVIIGSTFKVSAAVLSAVGFVVGIGSQSLVKDLINGFFILFEDQYGVGDYVSIGKYSGIVENIGIRSTVLRDFSGDLHVIPNGAVLEVTNHSRGNMRFTVDVEIAYEEDIDKVISLIEETCGKFKEDYKDEVREDIDVLGVISLNSSGITIRVVGKSKPLSQWKMERELRREIKKALDEAEIEIPYPKTEIKVLSNNI